MSENLTLHMIWILGAIGITVAFVSGLRGSRIAPMPRVHKKPEGG